MRFKDLKELINSIDCDVDDDAEVKIAPADFVPCDVNNIHVSEEGIVYICD